MIRNKKATYDYFLVDKEIAGMVLMGSEIRALRENHASISEAYIYINPDTEEVWIKGMYIKNDINNSYSHEEYRERKLLLTKKQIKKWKKELEIKQLTIVPISAFFDKRNRFKIEIALGKGKKLYDKREDIKKKDQAKQVDKDLKNF